MASFLTALASLAGIYSNVNSTASNIDATRTPKSLGANTVEQCRKSRNFLRRVFASIPDYNPDTPALPVEIVDLIVDEAIGRPPPKTHLVIRTMDTTNHPALTPPVSGACPLMRLPTELRRNIFWENFADKEKVFHPACGKSDVALSGKGKAAADKMNKNAHSIPNLMCVSQKICGELTEVLYEERTFVIHVHEGLKTGGVELLNTGRQPLQYQDSTEDRRFAKFADGKGFGFQRMRKIVIEIHPTDETQDRHLALNTHFMNLALCRLLERPTTDKQRITSMLIKFMGRSKSETDLFSRAAILRHGKPWLDRKGVMKQSTMHNVSDIELALRPFAMLTGCHNVSISLPAYLADDQGLTKFVAELEASMTSKAGTMRPNDILERHVETLRPEMEAHAIALLHGNGHTKAVAKLTEKDFGSGDEKEGENEGETLLDEMIDFETPDVSSRTRSKHVADAGLSTTSKRRKVGRPSPKRTTGRGIWDDVESAGMDEQAQLREALRISAQNVAESTVANTSSSTGSAPSLTLRRSTRVKSMHAARPSPELEAAESDDDDFQYELIMSVSRGDITMEQAQAILQEGETEGEEATRSKPDSRHTVSDTDQNNAQGDNPVSRNFLADRFLHINHSDRFTSNLAPAPHVDNQMPNITSPWTYTSGDSDDEDTPILDYIQQVRRSQSQPTVPAPSSTFTFRSEPSMRSSSEPNVQPTAVSQGAVRTGVVFAGHRGPLPPATMAPRAVMQAEDSGIGMLASDQGTLKEDEEMQDASLGHE